MEELGLNLTIPTDIMKSQEDHTQKKSENQLAALVSSLPNPILCSTLRISFAKYQQQNAY